MKKITVSHLFWNREMYFNRKYLLIFGIIVAFATLSFLQKAQAAGHEKKPNSISYDKVRSQWFSKPLNKRTTNPVYIGKSKVEAVGMEFIIAQSSDSKKAIVLAGATGDASIYFQSNNAQGVGGYIGGISHKAIAKAAIEMVTIASRHTQLMGLTPDFPYVSPGNVRFIVLTKDGMYSIEVKEQEVIKKEHPFFDLYSAGQQVITAYRESQS